jgi:hypothetical protein
MATERARSVVGPGEGMKANCFKTKRATRPRRRDERKPPVDPGWSVVFGGAFADEAIEAERLFGHLVPRTAPHGSNVNGHNTSADRPDARVKIRVERRAGDMLAEMEKNKGTRLGGSTREPPGAEPKLADIGITKKRTAARHAAGS